MNPSQSLRATGSLWVLAAMLACTQVQSAADTAYDYLCEVMDQYHVALDVYTDADAAGNHFPARGVTPGTATLLDLPPMNEACTNNPHRGSTCIECVFNPVTTAFGGWYFLNGYLTGTNVFPTQNWGTISNAGINLSGATYVSFWARGNQGGERVKFFCLGVGRDEHGKRQSAFPSPDSSATASVYVTLSTTWKRYVIDLSQKNLSYVLGGFGWVAKDRAAKFYLDDIRYNKPRLTQPRFLVSYKTVASTNDFDKVLRNVAFTYDNAVALLAFTARGDLRRAKLIADAFVYAQQHDRYYQDGRLRNAYQAGDISLPAGWVPNGRANSVRMPGWYDANRQTWLEDEFDVSTHTGNVAWAMLGLLGYYQRAGGTNYLAVATQLGNWVETYCRDTRGAGGYTAGFEGWEPTPTKLTYKATEHNVDLYAAFSGLYRATSDTNWLTRANYAKQFVLSMWDVNEQKFWTGTTNDGVTINSTVIPLDIQSWALLALREDGAVYEASLGYAEAHLGIGGGFDFNQDKDGIWFEGTSQMAAAYQLTMQQAKTDATLSVLHAAQSDDGGMPASSCDVLSTGFWMPDGKPWLYYNREHVGATGWLLLAEKMANPFWFSGRPDNTIRLSSDRLNAGLGVLSVDGTGETRSVSALRAQKRVFPIGIRNTGQSTDTFVVRGSPALADFVVKYFTGVADGTDITTAVTGAGYSCRLGVGAGKAIRVEITPRRTAPSGSVQDCLITSVCSSDLTKQDAVKATVTVR